jgi:hypothetical protein
LTRGRSEPRLVEEDLRHAGIEMLAGVDQDLADPVGGGERPRHRGRFDELRSGADEL